MDKELKEAIIKASRSEGYLIMITRLHDKTKLEHTFFTHKFPTAELLPSIEEHRTNIKKKHNI